MTASSVTSRITGSIVVAAAFVLAVFGWGVGFYGPPIYLHAVVEATGWPVPLVSAAVTLHFLIGTLVVANLPRLYGRFGLPAVTSLGAVALALGVVGWSVADVPWQLFAAALLSGVGWVTMGAAAVNAIIAPWFVRTRPAALAMAYNGASIGGVVFSPLWVALIGRFGFTIAAILVGVVMVIAIRWLSRVVFARTPGELGQRADGDGAGTSLAALSSLLARPLPGARLWRDRRFVTLAAGMALGLFAQIGLIAHLFSLLVPTLGAEGAGLALALATASAIAGRTLVGWLMPAGADRRIVACAAYGVQVLGSLALMLAGGESVPLLLLGVILFGSGIGNATSLPPLIAQQEFVEADVQRVVSLIVAIAQASYAFAPVVFGALRAIGSDPVGMTTGDATAFYAVAAVIQLAAIASLAYGRR